MPEWTARPFHRSLEALAQLAMRQTGACGYAYLEEDRARQTMARLAGAGPVDAGDANGRNLTVVDYPLRGAGRPAKIVFAFQSTQHVEAVLLRLDVIGAAIQILWARQPADDYADLLNRVVSLEIELIDSKIADRAKGFLVDDMPADPTEAILRHVKSVMRPSQAQRLLQEALSYLEEEMEERKLVSRAKTILQGSNGISEDQAHAKLRIASRKSRRRLKDVALQVIGGQALLKGETG